MQEQTRELDGGVTAVRGVVHVVDNAAMLNHRQGRLSLPGNCCYACVQPVLARSPLASGDKRRASLLAAACPRQGAMSQRAVQNPTGPEARTGTATRPFT